MVKFVAMMRKKSRLIYFRSMVMPAPSLFPPPGAALKIVTTMKDLYFFLNTILFQTS